MSDFGNLTRDFQRGAGASSGTRALFMGGGNSTSSGNRIHLQPTTLILLTILPVLQEMQQFWGCFSG